MPIPVTLNQPELAVVRAINAERVAHGLAELRPTRGLGTIARFHSRDQMRHFTLGHASSDGRTFTQRVGRVGRFRAAGEVVSWTSRGRATARRVVRMWMASPPHRAELLDPRFRRIGVGRARGPRGTWVTADLVAR